LLLAGGIIGSGIFLTAKDVAINTRHPWLFLTVWVVGMGMALLACFAFAELGGMFPHAGGQYVYMREAYGDTAGFLYGWMYFTVSATGTVAALGVGFATYLGQTFPALHAEQVILPLRFVDITRGHLIALAAIALQTLINIFGVKKGAVLQNIATWAKFGAIAPCLMSGARVYYAMAEDGIFFHSLARVHPRWHTPVMSLVLQGIWAGVLTLSGKYDELFTYVMFMMVLSYVLTVAGLFVLRRKQPDLPRPYRCTGYPWLPAIYVVLGSLWALNAAVEKRKETLVGTAIVLLGVPFYLYWKKQRNA
jgi:amino acid transporter